MDSTTVQFPIGITLDKDFETQSGWSLNPSLDLGVLFTAGDTDVDQRVFLSGVNGSVTLNSEIMDEVAFQDGIGFGAGKDGLSFNIEYSINASENQTTHGVSGLIRYEF